MSLHTEHIRWGKIMKKTLTLVTLLSGALTAGALVNGRAPDKEARFQQSLRLLGEAPTVTYHLDGGAPAQDISAAFGYRVNSPEGLAILYQAACNPENRGKMSPAFTGPACDETDTVAFPVPTLLPGTYVIGDPAVLREGGEAE